ncbi:hypothetical protein KIN20_013355 [Parelaphostrongylus tenuis]|uniref:Uncharacterized protein n=1 Tax=Parelaphostrongylus tenuis TaxID=148309 RepID=A0AAD5MDF6_PARTN|nr:hypothetical protein KIN20_013355 [Parelaphostrongylus tenuis]
MSSVALLFVQKKYQELHLGSLKRYQAPSSLAECEPTNLAILVVPSSPINHQNSKSDVFLYDWNGVVLHEDPDYYRPPTLVDPVDLEYILAQAPFDGVTQTDFYLMLNQICPGSIVIVDSQGSQNMNYQRNNCFDTPGVFETAITLTAHLAKNSETTAILLALVDQGVDPSYITISADCYRSCDTKIRLFYRSLTISVVKGVRQGDNIHQSRLRPQRCGR